MTLDVLCMMAHPDDAELLCGGTLIRLKDQGYGVGIIDFTRGEMGSRGDAGTRANEATCAAEVMGVDVRLNLGLPDANIESTVENRDPVIRAIREYRPHVIITHHTGYNRNPDHTGAARLVTEACFTAGLVKYDTGQEPHRPNKILHTMEYYEFEPTFYYDITGQFERMMRAVACYRSQTYNPDAEGPPTYIASDRFTREIEARRRYFGSRIHVDYAEAFMMKSAVEIRDIVSEIGLRALIPGQGRPPGPPPDTA